MNMRRALLNPVALLLFAATLGIRWESAPAQVSDPWNTALVAIQGTVTGQPETVSFSGQARIESRMARDPRFNEPNFVISIDLSGLSGVGSSSGAKYVISGPEIVQVRVAPSHQIDITFPFLRSNANLLSAQSGAATFALNFDVNTAAVTSATGNVGSLPR